MSNEQYTNKLINESSPYLLQHAHNPVEWYPWGEKAFEKAKAEDKSIFLSIGYSTCHWCHVMAHESFEDEQIAALLNAHFVSIKVDREERPDVDEVYMSVCQAMTGSGGWPLSILMTPGKKPFFAGTYFPPRSAYGRMGFTELIVQIAELWKTNRTALLEQSEKVIRFMQKPTDREVDESADEAALIEQGYHALLGMYDREYGGFSHAPKFPMPHYLSFLLMYDLAYKSKKAVEMATFTLEQMARGGIFDQAGFGFSRYSTDGQWLVPHFEKMLYDNALLLTAYSECYAVTGNALCREIAEKVCAYVMRDMTSPEGAFYSAQDADSEGEEGRFYVWSYEALQRELTTAELRILEIHYGVTRRGNFEGRNILNRTDESMEDAADAAVLSKLFALRQQRIPPLKDTKISASWNGLMIEALATAGMVMGNTSYVEAAQKAADFVIAHMVSEDGSVSTIYGKPGSGFLADHANMACALDRLYTATLNIRYLEQALKIAERMVHCFLESGEDRFYMAEAENGELFMRPRDEYDGAMPSGTASAMMALSRLVHLTGNEKLKKVLKSALAAFSATAKDSPASHVHYLSVLLSQLIPHRQIVIVAHPDDHEAVDAYRRICAQYMPYSSVIYYDQSEAMDELMPDLKSYRTDKPFAAYVCEDFTCGAPLHSAKELLLRLKVGEIGTV